MDINKNQPPQWTINKNRPPELSLKKSTITAENYKSRSLLSFVRIDTQNKLL